MKSKKPLTYDNALSRAAALCAKCEQCSPDIVKKLESWGMSARDITGIIGRLKEIHFIDDGRFARAFTHDKLCFNGWGRRKIAQALWAKRLPRHLITAALDDIDEDEYAEMAEKVIRNKAKTMDDPFASYESRVKLLRYGMQRGFESPVLAGIIRRLKTEEE